MSSLILSYLLGFFAELVRGAITDWRRDRAIREAGYQDAVRDASDAADTRKGEADAALDHWNSLDDDGRERVREQRGHYRD